MSKPLTPPSVEELLAVVRIAGGRYDYNATRMCWHIAMPAPNIGDGIWKSIEVPAYDLVSDKYQNIVRNFLKDGLAHTGDSTCPTR